MKIVKCGASDRDAWNTYVSGAPDCALYQRFEWMQINADSFGHDSAYLAAAEGGAIVGIFPLVHLKSHLFGNIACSLPFVNYGGLSARDGDVEIALLKAAEEQAEAWGVDYLEIRGRRPVGDGLPTSQHKISMTVDLNSDPEVLFKAYHTTHRQAIRRGYKTGLTARTGGAELLDDFYGVLSESWRDLGTPIYSKSYLARVAATFPDAMRITVVYGDGEPAAAAFYMFDRGIAEGMWLGSRGKFRRSHAGYVLYWETIKHSCEQGLVRYHLGRSTVESGGEMFKKKWNAYSTQLYWQFMLRTRRDMPQLNVDNLKYRLAIKTWQRLPVSVTQMIGPLISRSIP